MDKHEKIYKKENTTEKKQKENKKDFIHYEYKII